MENTQNFYPTPGQSLSQSYCVSVVVDLNHVIYIHTGFYFIIICMKMQEESR